MDNDCIMELFSLDVLGTDLEPFGTFEEGVQFCEEVLTEASVGVTIKNAISKFVKLCRSFASWIAKKLMGSYPG